jgi:hypothetical protein
MKLILFFFLAVGDFGESEDRFAGESGFSRLPCIDTNKNR